MKPQDVVVFWEKLSGFAAWKWVFFRACEIDALALGDESPGAKAFHIGEERWDAGLYDRLV